MKSKHLLSISDLTIAETNSLIREASETKNKKHPQVLSGKIVALLFEKPSLRTRVSFQVAIQQLGGFSLYLSPEEVGLGKREPVSDVAHVLGRYVHCIIARTFAHKSLEILAEYSGLPVINALSDWEHPCQALADILTIYEKKGKLKGLSLAYVGDANNVSNSLMLAAVQTGIDFHIASPQGYQVDPGLLNKAKEFASQTGSGIFLTEDPGEAVKSADVVYTDVWTSMGQEAEAQKRKVDFAGFQVNESLLSLAKKDAIFLHPLPAHAGEEIAAGILEHPGSVVFDQAENRLHIQRTLLVEMFKGTGRHQ